jgi:putative phosphoesterase
MLKKIGVIGDIHAEPERLSQSLIFLQQLDLDILLCTGDIVDGRGDVDECISLLQQYDVKTVLGNHDAWFLKNTMRNLVDATPVNAVTGSTMDYIQSLPVELEFDTSAGRILLCHGLGKHLMAKVGEDDYGYALDNNFELQDLILASRYRFVINGHTHHRMVRDFSRLTVINAGSLLYSDASFQTINFNTGSITVYSPDAPEKVSENVMIPGIFS